MDSFKDIWSKRRSGARDSQRHKERIRKAIKENLRELIAEESIISSKGGKKIKVPIKYLDMWRFKFGKNKNAKGVGFGEGDPGDVVGIEPPEGKGTGEAGDQPGEEVYEEEVEYEEIIEMMLEDLNLPWLEEKEELNEIETEETVFQDIAEKGLPSNIDKRRTVLENMKRNASKGKMRIGGFSPEDLRYKVWENIIERHSNAAVVLVMDRSGSMSHEKKYIVKSFFWWMVRFIEKKHDNVELVFIAHDTEAREVEEENFFNISQSGGTFVSSGFKLANKIIEERFPTNIWNNYIFAWSDGDNWPEDNDRCVEAIRESLTKCQAVGYGEVRYNEWFYNWAGASSKDANDWSHFGDILRNNDDLSQNKHFIMAKVEKREDVYSCLRKFLSDLDEGKK
jgi:hypothetical protein